MSSSSEMLDGAIEKLKDCGYSIGDAAVSDKGHILIQVGDRYMTHAEIYALADECGEPED